MTQVLCRSANGVLVSALYALTACGGSAGIVSPSSNGPPLGTYANTNLSPQREQISFPRGGSNTCLGLFDSSIQFVSETSALEMRRYLMPASGSTQAIVVESSLAASVEKITQSLYVLHHSTWDDTATYSRTNGQDVLSVHELFSSSADCSSPTRVSVTYTRK